MTQDVFTLLCKRDISMALATFPSILKSLAEGQKLVVFDDGSFDEDTIGIVKSIAPQIEVSTLNLRNDTIDEALANYPNCRKYRSEFPLAFKLLDIPIQAMQTGVSRLNFTDSDIIYYNNSADYFNRSVNTFLRTDAIKLSVKLQCALLKYRWKLPLRFNSGYFSFDLKNYDLDFIEYYLGLPNVRNIPWLSEQTCWALLFGRAGEAFCPDENQFVCREDFLEPNSSTFAVHLIGGLKGKVSEWSKLNISDAGEKLQVPRFESSRNIQLLDWIKKTIYRIKF